MLLGRLRGALPLWLAAIAAVVVQQGSAATLRGGPQPLPQRHPGVDCFHLAPGEGSIVHSVKTRYANSSYLVARPTGVEEPIGQAALRATFEAVLDDCRVTPGMEGSAPWFVDVTTGDLEIAAMAGSLGCSVAAFDPDGEDAASLEMTRCINQLKKPFVIFPALAGAEAGKRVQLPSKTHENGTAPAPKMATTATIDSAFAQVSGAPPRPAEIAGANWGAEVALLKITPRGCCGAGATMEALRGAVHLAESGRVKCFAVELSFDRDTTKELLQFLHSLEREGYLLAHPGPTDSSELEVTEAGSYPLFKTSFKQLFELRSTLERIRKFDERSGYRAYSGGVSLDRDGRYFEYAEMVLACRTKFPSKLVIKEQGDVRFKDGQWWIDEKGKGDAGNSTA